MLPPSDRPSLPRLRAHHELAVSGTLGSLSLRFEARFAAPWTVLFGPSGCGKSTILRAMCGLTEGLAVRFLRFHSTGQPLVLQRDDLHMPSARRKLGYAPQSAGLFPHLSVAENVSFALRVRARKPESSSLVDDAVNLMRLRNLRDRLPRELSGGERQRVSLARALAVPDSCVLLLDEPFAGIDRALRDQLLSDIQQWAEQRRLPVISVTHDVDEAFLLRAEVLRLNSGSVIAQGQPSEVLADEAARMQRALNTGVDT